MMPSIEARTEQRNRFAVTPTLSQSFNHWFDVVSADTPALTEQAYRLRYQVYCKENRYENPQEHPEGRETDDFDPRSVHTLLLDRSSRSVAGTVRLILPHQSVPEASFPIHKVCPLLTSRKQFPTESSAEISRFAVSKEYRKHLEALSEPEGHDDFLAERRILMPCITLGLMKGILRMSVEHGITDLLAVMEPALLRLLSRFGIYFAPIGQLVDYHGMRQPCHVKIASLLDRVRKDRPDVWAVITDEGKLLQRIQKSVHHFSRYPSRATTLSHSGLL